MIRRGELWWADLDIPVGSATGHHIHDGVAGVNGPVVVNFSAAYSGTVVVTPTQAALIIADPARFYVNLHTAAFPGGELRGQLAAIAAPGAAIPTLSLTMLLALGLGLAGFGALVFRRSKRL